ncbi:AAA family ATPase [Salipiger mucosus]|uniref:NadR/Ttd14 AAA domain-containing protein n=1 Tax=Salipiger mucosus DSM 16094 TaxID=1123237 RepID=S9QT76_9RHOB|nr:AAA family ATPase [Salipiger mucosus]EPX82827.1 hypothetical protein Salmuc_05180 [Salipiger mucosus DSM 16094]
MQHRHVILSGCSGGGKSTLLAELARRGHATVPEPGRRIVAEELRGEGRALPWVDLAAFARRAIALADRDRAQLPDTPGPVFFDRGLVDAAVALEHATGQPAAQTLRTRARFHDRVFLAPPWPEIHHPDPERRQDLQEGIREYHRLRAACQSLGYTPIILPKADVAARADLVLAHLA